MFDDGDSDIPGVVVVGFSGMSVVMVCFPGKSCVVAVFVGSNLCRSFIATDTTSFSSSFDLMP